MAWQSQAAALARPSSRRSSSDLELRYEPRQDAQLPLIGTSNNRCSRTRHGLRVSPARWRSCQDGPESSPTSSNRFVPQPYVRPQTIGITGPARTVRADLGEIDPSLWG